jgi:NADH:ubiquinone oxidoreductase subunit 2 (subunit N)
LEYHQKTSAMYQTVQILHSYWAYLVVLVVLIATLNALAGFFGNREYAPKDFRISLFALIVTHIQFVIGLVLYFISPLGFQNISNSGMSEVMGNSLFRLYAIEHPLIMLLTVILITIGYSKHKKKLVSKGKFKALAIFYTIGLILMLSRIPWDQWFD